MNVKLTNLEKQVINEMIQKDGNGEYILDTGGQYLSVLGITLSMKQLRGVLSSLVKKELIEIDNDEYGTIINITDNFISIVNQGDFN